MFIGNIEFKRGKDKRKRKRRGFGLRAKIQKSRDGAARKLGSSAIQGSLNRARKGKFTPGLANRAKIGLASRIASDKKGVTKALVQEKNQRVNAENKIAKRQAKDLNSGKKLMGGDKAAAGLYYDRTSGKYKSAKLS